MKEFHYTPAERERLRAARMACSPWFKGAENPVIRTIEGVFPCAPRGDTGTLICNALGTGLAIVDAPSGQVIVRTPESRPFDRRHFVFSVHGNDGLFYSYDEGTLHAWDAETCFCIGTWQVQANNPQYHLWPLFPAAGGDLFVFGAVGARVVVFGTRSQRIERIFTLPRNLARTALSAIVYLLVAIPMMALEGRFADFTEHFARPAIYRYRGLSSGNRSARGERRYVISGLEEILYELDEDLTRARSLRIHCDSEYALSPNGNYLYTSSPVQSIVTREDDDRIPSNVSSVSRYGLRDDRGRRRLASRVSGRLKAVCPDGRLVMGTCYAKEGWYEEQGADVHCWLWDPVNDSYESFFVGGWMKSDIVTASGTTWMLCDVYRVHSDGRLHDRIGLWNPADGVGHAAPPAYPLRKAGT